MKLYEIKNYFKELLKENMSTDMLTPGDISGGFGGDIGNGDNYAPGDNRIPYSLFGGIIKRNGKVTGHKKKRKNKEEDAEELIDYEKDDLTPEEWKELEKLQDKTGKSTYELIQMILKKKGTLSDVNRREIKKWINEIKASLKD